MKTKNNLGAYILRATATALLLSFVSVALCSAIHLPGQFRKVTHPQDNASFGVSRSLSFAERVAYQTEIDDVYWRQRIWPKTNPGTKPPLSKVMSQADIEKKVAGYLRNSQVLEHYRQRQLTADELQAEMERMAKHTRQPEVLQQLFEALGNDPFVIAECLARPILTERLTANVLAQDKTGRFESLRTHVPQIPREVVAIETIAKAVQVNRPYYLPVIASPSGDCDAWTPTTLTNAPPGRYLVTSVWTGTEMIVWGGEASGAQLNTGGRYNPSTDSWTATSTTNAPDGRRRHSAVWTGSEMIVWGGYNGDFLNTGGKYNPSTDSWIATSTTNAPAARSRHGVVWTGSEMIVWGGRDLGTLGFNTGGRYDPNTDSWTATTTTNAPSGRSNPAAIWTGSEMIVWGGQTGQATLFNTGGRYNPSTDSWTAATSTTNAPAARQDFSVVWTDSEMIVWGGYNGSYLNTGGRYDPSTDSWTATSTTNAPAGRSEHTAVWTGSADSEMIVWGGNNGSPLNTGGRYDSSTDSWTATSTTNAPSGRYEHTAVWADSEIEMIVWGGRDVTAVGLNTGGKYCAVLGLRVISSDPSCGSVVFSEPTDFVINLSDPVQPPTVQATDFAVNATPANSFSLSNNNTTIIFHYTSSPVITQGEQTMHIPAGAFLGDPDGHPVIAFNCTFRYDATLLAVTNTVPPVGGTFSPPAPGTYEYDVNWNEAVDPTSIQASDLTLSGNTGAIVTNVEVINGDTTTRFTLYIPFGGSLTADIAAGAITDQFGNPNAAFSGSYTVEGSCMPSGLLIVAGQTNEFYDYAELNDIVQYSFAQSQVRPNQFAVFQTHSPWGETFLTNHITANGYTYSIFGPAQLVGFNFFDYRVVVLDWSDTVMNEFIGPYSSVIPALEAYVNGGGVLWIEGATQDGSFPLPFGGTATYNTQNDNFIVDTTSPMIQGMPNPFEGDAASHVILAGYPGNTHVVVVGGTTNGGPTTLYELRPSVPCSTATPSPTPTVTSTATATPTATATVTPTATPTVTASSTPRPAPTPRSRPTPAPRP